MKPINTQRELKRIGDALLRFKQALNRGDAKAATEAEAELDQLHQSSTGRRELVIDEFEAVNIVSRRAAYSLDEVAKLRQKNFESSL